LAEFSAEVPLPPQSPATWASFSSHSRVCNAGKISRYCGSRGVQAKENPAQWPGVWCWSDLKSSQDSLAWRWWLWPGHLVELAHGGKLSPQLDVQGS
jgi:hypothetical protein